MKHVFLMLLHCANTVCCFVSIVTTATVRKSFLLNGASEYSKLLFSGKKSVELEVECYVYTTSKDFPKPVAQSLLCVTKMIMITATV